MQSHRQTVPIPGSCVGGAGAVAGAQLLCCPQCPYRHSAALAASPAADKQYSCAQ